MAIIKNILKEVDDNLDKKTATTIKKLIAVYKSALTNIRDEIFSLEVKYGNDISYGQLQNLNRLRNLEITVLREVNKVSKKEILLTDESIKELYTTTLKTTANGINKVINNSLVFGVLNTENIETALTTTLDKIDWKSISIKGAKSLSDEIRTEIANGLITGKSYDKIAKNIEQRLTVGLNRSITIAKTETHRVVNQAKVNVFTEFNQSAQRLGYKTVKKWLSAKDSRTRDIHKHLNGVEADENGLWYLDNIPTKGPGLSGSAKNDIHCRCTVIYDIININ